VATEVVVDVGAGPATIKLNRPEELNALAFASAVSRVRP
jgi:enoyl-CoA hydratase/carnithine racemase